MKDFSKRIADLSPEQRALLEARLKKKGLEPPKIQEQAIPRRRSSEYLPLSFVQEQLWFLDQLQPGNANYNQYPAARLKGPLKVEALEQSLNEIVRRHEVFRTTFAAVEGQPLQVITPSLTIPLSLVDLRGVPEPQREAQRVAIEEIQRPFDLARGPLIRASLLRLGEQEHVVLLLLHHIITDGWSNGILLRELATLYAAFSSGKPLPLPELPIQYADYALWQREWLQGEALQSLLAYWKQQLGDEPPVLKLPTDRPRPAIQSFRGARHSFALPKPLTQAIEALSRQEGVTLFMTLLAAFKALLFRYTGQDDLLVGSTMANRTRREVEDLIGYFVNTIVLRTNLAGNPSFRELLRRVSKVTLGAQAHQALPFEILVKEIAPRRDLGRNPLFQVLFALQNTPMPTVELPGISLSLVDLSPETVVFDLTLSMEETEQGLVGTFEYATDLFDPATIVRMAGHFKTMLEGIVSNSEQQISDLPLLTPSEWQQAVVEWNANKAEYPWNVCLHQLFEAQVGRTPGSDAIVFEGETLSYRELNRRANRLAHYLQKLKVGPEVPVGICMERSMEMVVGLLGILKAGGAYVPLDPTYPKARLAFVAEDIQIPLLLTQKRLAEGLPDLGVQVVCLDTDWEEIAYEREDNPVNKTKAENLVYITYASDKAVLVEHRGVCNRLQWLQDKFSLSSSNTVLQQAPLALDTSVWEILWPLVNGGRLVIAAAQDPQYLWRLIAEQQVNILHFTPPALSAFLKSCGPSVVQLHSLRAIFCSGEPLSSTVVDEFLQGFSCELVNLYGPPEAALACSWQVRQLDDAHHSMPVGYPTNNTSIYVLDEHMQPVPVGVTGEIYIAGDGLARGYLHDEKDAVQCFVKHPFSDGSLFKSGDFGRRLNNGALELLGTSKWHTWIGGFRVELSTVEAALLEDPSVDECVVLARETQTGDQQLVAYLVPVVPVGLFTSEKLEAHLQATLPDYMLPRAYVPLATLPLTSTGEVDTQALLNLEVIDSYLVQLWQERLQSAPEIEHVAVVIQQQPEHLPPYHLSDLLLNKSINSMSGTSVPAVAPLKSVATHEVSQSTRLAISSGGPLQKAPGAPTTLPETLRRAALQSPEKGIVYLQADGTEAFQSYPALLEEAQRVLAGLRKLGLKPQDKVIFQFDRNEVFVAALWGCLLGGFVPVPIAVPPTYEQSNSTIDKLHNAWKMLDRPIVLSKNSLVPLVRSLSKLLNLEHFQVEAIDGLRTQEADQTWHEGAPEDLALLLLTSGSTGLPKGVMLSHRNILGIAAASTQIHNFSDQDISLNWMPLDHPGGVIRSHIRDVYLGCRQIHAPVQAVLQNPPQWLDWIDRYRATITWAPNFAYRLVYDHAVEISQRHWDLSSMQFIFNTGEAIVARTARRFLELLRPHGLPATAMHPAWGMAETSSGVVFSDRFSLNSTTDDDLFVDVGRPLPEISLRIVDAQNQVVSEDTVGRLQVKGLMVTSGYYQNLTLNQEVFTDDGWFTTGDLGLLHEGRLTITGREKDVIIINGVNYYSHEIEAVVEEVADVEASYTAACAVRDIDSDTDQLAIFFALSDEARLLERVKEIRGKVTREVGVSPAYVIPVERAAIPKTEIGKIQHSALSKRFAAGEFNAILKHLDVLSSNTNTLPDWFYQKVWRQKKIVTAHPRIDRLLVFLDQGGLGTRVGEELRRLHQAYVSVETGKDFTRIGPDHYRISPGNPDHYQRLLEAIAEDRIKIDQILHLWTYGKYAGEVASSAEFEQSQELGVYSLLFLAQALAKFQRATRLYVISSHTQPVSPDDELAYEQATVLGFLKTLSQEMPWLSCRHIDLPADQVELDATHILQELRTVQKESEVAYRRNQRLIPRLKKVDLRQEKKRELPFKPGGMYLLSGGLGGIGVEIARYLLKQYKVRLLLVGRTALPERETWNTYLEQTNTTAQRIKDYLSLEQSGGEVIYKAVDVCDVVQLQQAVEQAKLHWQCELEGVIHLAGIAQEQLLVDETRGSLAATLRPKVVGTWALHQLLKDRPQALFISFSSVNGFFGGTTVGAYSAANSFLDCFSFHQRHKSSLQSYCFAWSLWDEVGMSRGYQMKQLSQARGYYSISVERGLYSLLAALQSNQPQLLIGLDGSNQHIQQYLETKSYRTQKLSAYFTVKAHQRPSAGLQEVVIRDRFQTRSDCDLVQIEEMPLLPGGEVDLKALLEHTNQRLKVDYVAPRNEIERIITAIWQEVLRIDKVSIHDNFFELGGHSLLTTQLLARVRKAFQQDISLRRFFDAPTVAGLAAALELNRQGGSPDALAGVDLKADAILDPSIYPQAEFDEQVTGLASILLTGATGFLGAFLLRELLEQTQAVIYCLVRSSSAEEGITRIQRNMRVYSLWDDAFRSRVIPVVGDLSQPLLGLSAEQFDSLASTIDVIYHDGAFVNYMYPYAALKPTNVLGTQEVLRLACQSKIKPVHYISSIAVFSTIRHAAPTIIREKDVAEYSDALPRQLGYTQSKWVAEKLVRDAQSRGLPVCIYRLWRIAGHTQTGAYQTNDFLWRMIKACIQMRSMPVLDMIVDLTPVDYISKAVVRLSRRKESMGTTFHVLNPQTTHLNQLGDWIRSFGYPLEQMPYDEWRAALIDINESSRDNAAYPLVSLFFEGIPQEQMPDQTREASFDCQNTLTGLADSSIVCPPVDAQLLSTYFAYFIESGFLEAPPTRGKMAGVGI